MLTAVFEVLNCRMRGLAVILTPAAIVTHGLIEIVIRILGNVMRNDNNLDAVNCCQFWNSSSQACTIGR